MGIKRPEHVEAAATDPNRPELMPPTVYELSQRVAGMRVPTWYAGRLMSDVPEHREIALELLTTELETHLG